MVSLPVTPAQAGAHEPQVSPRDSARAEGQWAMGTGLRRRDKTLGDT